MKRVLIVQARMTSTRLPGKVLKEISGHPMLGHVLKRAARAKEVDHLLVATSDLPSDDPVAAYCAQNGFATFRGDEADVLNRYYQAARSAEADVIIRVTADCPLIDPAVIDKVVSAFSASPGVEFAANTLQRTYPRGLDVEVCGFAALENAWREAALPYHRAHVFPYIYETKGRFKLLSVVNECNLSWMRWTVDTEQDLAFIRAACAHLRNSIEAGWEEIVAALNEHPELLELNRQITQKPITEG